MAPAKKIQRLLYSTGGICTAIGVAALETSAEKGVRYQDHLLLFSVDGNPKFQARSEEHARALHNFKEIRHLEKFILDERLHTVDKTGLADAFADTQIDEVLVFAESSGTRFDALKSVFKGATISVYEEGMLGYCGKMFHNSKTGGLKTTHKFYSTNYFGKMFPQALKGLDVPVVKMQADLLRDNLGKSSEIEWKDFKPLSVPTALVCTAPLWRFNKISIEETVKAHVDLVKLLLKSGLVVYFKDHPRPNFKLFDSVNVLIPPEYRENFIDVSGFSSIAENIVSNLNPSITVGFGSTTLFNSFELYGIPSFRYKTELIPASLGYVEQHVINAALKLRYIPSINKLSQVDARAETHDSYRALAMEIFEQNLRLRQSSYDDEIIQRVANRLMVQKWPKPEAPAQVLDYIFLDDGMIMERNRKVRNLLTSKPAPKPKPKSPHKKKGPISAATKFLDNVGAATNLRLVKQTDYRKLQNELRTLKEANATLKTAIKSSELTQLEHEKERADLIKEHEKGRADLIKEHEKGRADLIINQEKLIKTFEDELTKASKQNEKIDKEKHTLNGRLMESRGQVSLGLSPAKWRQFRSVPIMDKSWSSFVKSTSFNDAYKAAQQMCRDMDEQSCRTAELVMQDAYLVSWEETVQDSLRYDTDFLNARSGIDFSKQEKLTKTKLEQISLGGSVNMGAVKQSLAYAHGLRELPVEISTRLTGRDFIDGGAYAGDSAFAFLDFRPRHIYCFEPAIESFDILQANIERGGKQELITAVKSGLSDTSGDAQLTQDLRAGNHIVQASEVTGDIQADSISLVSVDEFAEKQKLDVGLIKLDVEGFEQMVLNGATETIKKCRPFLLISVYHSAEDFLSIRDWIDNLQLGYDFRLRKFSPTPVMETVLIAIPGNDA